MITDGTRGRRYYCTQRKLLPGPDFVDFLWNDTPDDKVFVDIKFHPGFEMCYRAHYGQTWCHAQNRKCITYRNATRGGLSHGHGDMHKKFSEDRSRGSGDNALARTHRQTDLNPPVRSMAQNHCRGWFLTGAWRSEDTDKKSLWNIYLWECLQLCWWYCTLYILMPVQIWS